jgi:hypothetical protein
VNGGDTFDDLGPEEKIKFSQAGFAAKLAKFNDAIARRMAPRTRLKTLTVWSGKRTSQRHNCLPFRRFRQR